MSGTSELTGEPGEVLDEVLRSFEGRASGPPLVAPDAVGPAMIRHFVEAVGDENPVYIDDEAARASGRVGVVAPAAMLQAWTMQGLRQKLAGGGGGAGGAGAQDELMALLASRGFTSVVATDCEQDYCRELRPGDRLTATSRIESVSAEKRTALGAGHFVTSRTEFRDEAGEVVGRMMFRILLYRPAGTLSGAAPEGRRPRPLVTGDNAFFFDALRRGEIAIERCAACRELRHPPGPRCPACGSYDYDTTTASGAGTLHSFVVVHHPRMPGFDYPLVIGLVDLDEGVRLVAELAGVRPADLEIGMALRAEVVALDDELSVPRFRPASTATPPAPATSAEPAVGIRPPATAAEPAGDAAPAAVRLPALDIPLTRTLIVAGAIATRDYQDVHHDVELARLRGSPDIFMNILTTNGYVGRFVTDWAGPAAVIERIAIRLGAPNHPGDTMRMSGEVSSVEVAGEGTRAEIAVRGANGLGDHVKGTVRIRMPVGWSPVATT